MPIREWLNSYEMLGKEAKSIYPFWKEVIARYFEADTIQPIAFTGCSRGGKSYALLIMIVRIIYETGAYDNFPSLFNLSPTTIPKIFFPFILCYESFQHRC